MFSCRPCEPKLLCFDRENSKKIDISIVLEVHCDTIKQDYEKLGNVKCRQQKNYMTKIVI